MPFLSDIEKQLVLEHLAPLGCVPAWRDGQLTMSKTSARRFINDQTSVLQRPRNSRLNIPAAYDPGYLGIGIYEALAASLIQVSYGLYVKFFQFLKSKDFDAAEQISSCEQAAIILSHRSFGEELFTHIHAGAEPNRPTISQFYNLTGTGTSELILYPELDESSKAYRTGYTNHRVLAAVTRSQPTHSIPIFNGATVTFSAATTPHRFPYTDDVWLTLVYDQVGIE